MKASIIRLSDLPEGFSHTVVLNLIFLNLPQSAVGFSDREGSGDRLSISLGSIPLGVLSDALDFHTLDRF
jgi:hypothetical protein